LTRDDDLAPPAVFLCSALLLRIGALPFSL
jgi:hypothetical protein